MGQRKKIYHGTLSIKPILKYYVLFWKRICFLMLIASIPLAAWASDADNSSTRFKATIEKLSFQGDRSTGTAGADAAARYIKSEFNAIGLQDVGVHLFSVPVRRHTQSTLTLTAQNRTSDLQPFVGNAISPGTISSKGVRGPLVYVGAGELDDLNGKALKDAVVLMELDSGKNWLTIANYGAKALIYLERQESPKFLYTEKFELTPIRFPCFWMPIDQARGLFGNFEKADGGLVSSEVVLSSQISWQESTGQNIYGLIPGTDETLAEELIIVEAFYDSTSIIPGNSPGADEACGIVTLLEIARFFRSNPPPRSVMFLATAGHAQTLAGLREMLWSVHTRSKDQRKLQKRLKKTVSNSKKVLSGLKSIPPQVPESVTLKDAQTRQLVMAALIDCIKTEVDGISRDLMRLRLEQRENQNQELIKTLANHRLELRRFSWRNSLTSLSEIEKQILHRLVPETVAAQQAILTDAQRQSKYFKSAKKLRALVKSKEVSAFISLHLSSHGDGFGAFNRGWLHPLKPTVNRIAPWTKLDEVMRQGAAEVARSLEMTDFFKDTLRPSRRRAWQSYFLDKPYLGCEVSAIAGFHGVNLVTTNDARAFWGTPFDRSAKIDWEYAVKQSAFIARLLAQLAQAPQLHDRVYPRDGLSFVTGRAKFLRQGELFADQPAPGTMIMAYQGAARHYAMVDQMGVFHLRGVADKKHILHKVIIEGYKFHPETGETLWAIDKKQTGKNSYRVKMVRRTMETDLVMFAAKQTTLFNLLEPRTFRFMTKINLLDARREAMPLRYWWSRIDTWESVLASICVEPGTPFKLTLSDNVIRNKLILTNATEERADGAGYIIDDVPFIHFTELQASRDMWALLAPRIANLEKHGIFNERIRNLQNEGLTALGQAEQALQAKNYVIYAEAAPKSWALASRVYDDVEKTQKDVLYGVLFYIALFVPFAFCMERLLFSFRNIYKRIIAFCGILILLIGVVYHVHPAFQLAYSPMVVILAFFIMGLSLIVTLIIFFRFEEEMISLQKRASPMAAGELSRWKAFVASFLLGVSNLKRRRLRTALTCTTLIILTFTIMSFTSVKTNRMHSRILYQKSAPYQGFLLKNVNWQSLPPAAISVFANAFEDQGLIAPRAWLEDEDATRATRIPVRFGARVFEAQGMVGLSAQEDRISGLTAILSGGRWFHPSEKFVVLLPERMAAILGIDPKQPDNTIVSLWGMPFKVTGTFSSQKLKNHPDLDGEPLTPVIFPRELSADMTEEEVEAMESGDDIRAFQSRYEHIDGDLTVIVPFQTLLTLGGQFKSAAIRPITAKGDHATAQHLVDRFGLSLFSGEPEGTFLYNASDTLSYSGVPNIVIPIIISVFIVLNTMIGSVYERKREIAVYTSVGLAPSHVSFLFIAEAMAFAVLSVVLGYLLAQVTASLFAGTSLWAGITVNYSSLAGVAAMLLVILVVLISAIYPSKVAAQIAIPDVNRSWTLPAAQDNELVVTLPFLMKHIEHRSVGGFIFDYFKGHQDVSHGIFSTGQMDILYACQVHPHPTDTDTDPHSQICPIEKCEEEVCLRLQSSVWLAPFDLGIMQGVDLSIGKAQDDSGFLEITLRLTRESGEANAWHRINKPFLHQLRRQLLMWRSLDPAAQKYYAELLNTLQNETSTESRP